MARGAAHTLLEREDELDRLTKLLGAAARGRGTTLLLEGAAGIGKSRLLSATCAAAAEKGFRVLRAAGSALEHEYGFGVAQQLFEPALAQASPEEAHRLLDGAARLSAGVLHSAGGVPWNGASALTDEHSALHGLYWLTVNLSDAAPLLIAVDDVQWADSASLRFLLHLCHRIDELPALLVLAARSGERAATPELIDALRLASETPTMRPRTLSTEAATALAETILERDLEPEVANACVEATGGNPFLLVELLGALAQNGAGDGLTRADVRGLTPERVLAAITLRLRRLGPDAVDLARAVAVLGQGATAERAADLAALEASAAADTVDALIRADILAEDDHLTFRHPLQREAVYSDLPRRERAAAHRRAASLLRAAIDPDPEMVGLHLMLVPPDDDAEVLSDLRAAAQAALARGGAETARDYLLRATRQQMPGGLRAEVLAALALAAGRAGRGDAGTWLEQAFVLTDTQPQRASIGLRLIGARAASTSDPAQVGQLLEQALDGVGDTELPSELEACAILYIVGLPAIRARFRDRLDRVHARIEGLAPSVLSPVSADMVTTGATARDAAALAERALVGGELIRQDIRTEIPLSMPAILTLTATGRLQAAIRAVESGVAQARAAGSLFALARFLPVRALVAFRCGDLVSADSDARECLELAGQPGWELATAMAATVLAAVCLERGRPDAARELLLPLDRVPAAEESVALQILREVRVRMLIAGDEPEAALVRLEEYVQWARRCEVGEGLGMIPWRSLSALAHLRTDNAARARELADEEVAVARAFGAEPQIGIALMTAGLAREGAAAARMLHEAVDVLAPTDARLDHARALIELGSRLARDGDNATARDTLAEGMDRANRCGATALVDRAHSTLVSLGARPRRIARTGLEGLTASQLRVARLAAGGMTNREIAQTLFLTVRTVELHLSNAYRTLGIASRAHLKAIVGTSEEPSELKRA